jgi:hypothetical protein
MDQMITYCGLVCDTCPIHLATLETDISKKVKMRISIAEELSKIYGTIPEPKIITDCDGCKTNNGRLFTGCIDCKIRKCAIQKNITNCAYCGDYPCDNLKKHFTFDPASKERLEKIQNNN